MGCHAGLASGNGALVAFLKRLTSTEQPAIQKVQLTPEFIEPILDRCPGQSQTEVGPQAISSPGYLTVRVFNGLRLIEHYRVPGGLCQRVCIEAQDGVCRQRHVCSCRERALRTMMHTDAESWPKPAQFVSPVVQYAGRSHHEGTTLEDTERL